MSTDKKRRLAAIMFADIVGYTSMMQRNETEGLASVHRFSEVMEGQAKAYQGEVLEFRGDGCLVVFDSAVEAVHAAKAIQGELQQEPVVPLRIGIHLGDIVFTKGNIYGDGVNLASRVESMGVPGSILITERIIHDVKSHPEFEITSLGQFQFKNVEKPMEVFALANEGLAVPRPDEMKGKGDRIKPRKPGMKAVIRLASVGFVAMAIGAVLFWILGSRNTAGQLSEEIKEERVAIIPFNNRTSDHNLDVFGAFCSDLITNGLTEARIKTCSPRTIQQYNHLIGVLPNNPEGKPSFSEVVGVRYWVEGYFSQIGDTLTVKSHLTDGLTGNVLRNFPDMKGHIQNKEQLADQLTRRIMGYWVAKETIDKGKFKPPTYEAFVEYQKAFQLAGGIWGIGKAQRPHGRRAFELDSTFYTAALLEMLWLADARNPRTDTLIAKLEPHLEEMTPFEKLSFEANQSLYANKAKGAKDWQTYRKIREKQYQLFPQDFVITSFYGYHLATRENMAAKAWEVMNQIDFANLPKELSQWRITRVNLTCMFGIMAAKYEEVISLCNRYLRAADRAEYGGIYAFWKSLALVRSGQFDSLTVLSEEIKQMERTRIWHKPEYDLVGFCNEVANNLMLQDKREKAHRFLNMALDWGYEHPERMKSLYDSLDLAETYRLLGNHEKALAFEIPYLSRYEEMKDNWFTKNGYLTGIAIDYALSGEREKAEALIGKIGKQFRTPVYAVLGEKGQAMKELEELKERGVSIYGAYHLQNEYFNKNLFGYPPFEAFVRVRD